MKVNDTDKKAFSLAETVIGLGIMSIILLIFFNVIIVALRSSAKTLAQTQIRDEVNAVTSLFARDVRNANQIGQCGLFPDPFDEMSANPTEIHICRINTNNGDIYWRLCQNVIDPTQNSVCKYLENEGSPDTLLYISTDNLYIQSFEFVRNTDASSATRGSILFTIVAGHLNETVEVSNVFSQVTASTRNFILAEEQIVVDSICGNGILDPGEECDGIANCSVRCTTPVCGDGVTEGLEQCDGGTCNPNCTLPVCGNSIVEVGEECDGDPDCSNQCEIICTEDPIGASMGRCVATNQHSHTNTRSEKICTTNSSNRNLVGIQFSYTRGDDFYFIFGQGGTITQSGNVHTINGTNHISALPEKPGDPNNSISLSNIRLVGPCGINQLFDPPGLQYTQIGPGLCNVFKFNRYMDLNTLRSFNMIDSNNKLTITTGFFGDCGGYDMRIIPVYQ